jgi:hypothetical protein
MGRGAALGSGCPACCWAAASCAPPAPGPAPLGISFLEIRRRSVSLFAKGAMNSCSREDRPRGSSACVLQMSLILASPLSISGVKRRFTDSAGTGA